MTDLTPTPEIPEDEPQAESVSEEENTPVEIGSPIPENVIDPHLEAQVVQERVAAQTVEPAAPVAKNDDVVLVPRATLNYVVIAITFFILGIGLGSIYFGNGSSADVDEDAIGEIVRELLVEAELLHPYIDDMNTLVDDDPYLGEEDAPITIVEFSAYACPYCGRHFNTTLTPLFENYGQYIRYVYRDHPIINQSLSFPASIAANCAYNQGKFWEYHTILFENQNLLAPSFFIQTAEDLGLDMETFNNCYEDDETANEVIRDYNAASALNITGTPSFYINGTFHSGAQSYEYFERVILDELSKLNINDRG